MRACQSFKCLFWATLYCVLYLVSASEEDLSDFDFKDLKEIDWNYNNENTNTAPTAAAAASSDDKKMLDNIVTFDDYDEAENQVRPFDWREKILRIALSKALTNVALRQKFVEVMPILRVLSKQQRLALSALISAQINAKKGQELKLEQVRMMFGDDKKLLLPIVYDIANLVRNSARKYLNFELDAAAAASTLKQIPIANRKFDLSSVEIDADDDSIGTIPVSGSANDNDGSLEDFFGEMPDDVLDPKSINEELQEKIGPMTNTSNLNTTATARNVNNNLKQKRSKRQAIIPANQLVHKLIRSMPLSVNEDELVRGSAGRTVKLNSTAFLQAKESNLRSSAPITKTKAVVPTAPITVLSSTTVAPTENVAVDSTALSYQETENLAFASLNGTEISLNLDSSRTEGESHSESNEELLPTPEELISGPRYRIKDGNKMHLVRSQLAANRKRTQLRSRPKVPPYPAASPISAGSKKCERFTASMCIRTDDYPLEQIMGSIRRHKNAMSALLAEYYDKANNLETSNDDFDDFDYNKRRRGDDASGGGMCKSIVRYARPQKARSASGEWKYIVNTAHHTQTLRMEKCTNPQESCSYLTQSYRSHCSQVYNYHRLLSWDKKRGLHVDIFKVPTCCSCQVDGYRQQFPPLTSTKLKDYTPAYNTDTYSTINEELDYNDDEENEDDDFRYQLVNDFGGGGGGGGGSHHKRDNRYDSNELFSSSKNVRTKAYPPKSTVGSYLSPPGGNDYEFDASERLHHHHRGATSTASNANHGHHTARRRPYKSLSNMVNEERVDLEVAPSESYTEKEVNFFGTPPHANDKASVHQQNRKHIYSVPHTATSSTTATRNTGVFSPTHRNDNNNIPNRSGDSITSNAHQTTATRPTYYTSSTTHSFRGKGNGGNAGQTKSRFRPATTSANPNATPSTTTESNKYYYKASTTFAPPIYHVNSIYSSTYNANSNNTSKRINYSYHPIIDFFESNKRSGGKISVSTSATPLNSSTKRTLSAAAASSETSSSSSSSNSANTEHIYPYKIPKSNTFDRYQTHERRMGYGAAATAGGVSGGGGGSSFSPGDIDDNVWHPVIVES